MKKFALAFAIICAGAMSAVARPALAPAPAVPVVWVIEIYNELHQPQGTMTAQYPDADSCHAGLAVQHFNFPYWGACVPVTPTPLPMPRRRR